MISVLKREFSTAFHRFYAYVIVGILALGSAIFFFSSCLDFASENIVTVVSNVSLLAAVALPPLAINAFPSRKGTNTDLCYELLPVSGRQVLFGKYLASLCVALIPTALIALYPLIASAFVDGFDMSVSYSAVFALSLFEMTILSAYFYIASASRGRVASYIICYATVVVWYFIGIVNVLIPLSPMASLICFLILFAAVGVLLFFVVRKLVFSITIPLLAAAIAVVLYVIKPQAFSGAFEKLMDGASIFSRFDTFIYGVFDIESVIFFFVLSATLIFLAYRNREKRYDTQARRGLRITGVASAMTAVCVIISALGLSVGAAAIPKRYTQLDATAANKSTVGAEAKAFLEGLDKDVVLYVLEPTDSCEYDLYIRSVANCSDRIRVEEIYNATSPEFYQKRGISIDNITANSIVIECGESSRYLSYLNMFVYSNEVLGFSGISLSDYQYYIQLFSQNSSYSEYLYSMIYDTSLHFQGDLAICSLIEYVSADMIPASYYLTGHGETDSGSFGGYSLEALDISEGDIPADAASILINMPKNDITDGERAKLTSYLNRGGQLTFVSGDGFELLENFNGILKEFGMSSNGEKIKSVTESEDGDKLETTIFKPRLNYEGEVLSALDGLDFSMELDGASAIVFSPDTLRKDLLHYSLLTVEANDATYTVGGAAEDSSGARIAWYTGGGSYNGDSSNAALPVALTVYDWVGLKYVSVTSDIPTKLYQSATYEISSGVANIIGVLICLLPIAFVAVGAVKYYKRRRTGKEI